ncbi:hypothetical protein ABPG74_007221 [Tetrahymena malaccensis]
MKYQAVLLILALLCFVNSQSSNKSCSYNFTQQTCAPPCVFTPDQSSFVCQSKCSSLDSNTCSSQPSCSFQPGFCQLTVNVCTYIQYGSSLTLQQCLNMNSNCIFTPAVKEDCTVLDNVKQSCSAKLNDYYGCFGIKNSASSNQCAFTPTTQICSPIQNFQCTNTPSCDQNMCDYTPCAQQPNIVCSNIKNQTDCPSDNCSWDSKSNTCNENCTNQTADKCPKACVVNQCISNSDKQTKYCNTLNSDQKCVADSRCKVASLGTCDPSSSLCSVTSNLTSSCPSDSCKYTPPKNPTCTNPVCTKGYSDNCDPYCAPIPPRCTPNGLSTCGTLKTQSDCNNSAAFCNYSQSGTCATLTTGSTSKSHIISVILVFQLFIFLI